MSEDISTKDKVKFLELMEAELATKGTEATDLYNTLVRKLEEVNAASLENRAFVSTWVMFVSRLAEGLGPNIAAVLRTIGGYQGVIMAYAADRDARIAGKIQPNKNDKSN